MLVEERVMQLQEISRRRNELLREMYHLIQKRDNLGSLVTLEEEEEENDEQNLQLFLERFDLERHPNSGHISSLLDEEVALPETPPAYSPVCVIAPEPPPLEPENAVNVISESPMSEPPASPPPNDIREEEEEEEEVSSPQIPDVPHRQQMFPWMSTLENVAVRETSPVPNATLESPGVVEQELHPSQDAVPGKSPTPTQQDLPSPSYNTSSLESPIPQSSAESFAATREPSSSRTSLPPSQLSQPSPLQLLHDGPDTVKEEPLDNDDMEVAEPEPPAKSPSPAERTSVPFETVAPAQLTKEHSEDQIMAILGPSQQPLSPLLVDEHVLRRAVDYAIPHPQLHPASLFTFNDGVDQPMAVENGRGPHEFGPDPQYPLPPLHMLPMEFVKKKSKRNKKGGDVKKEEWQPMGLNRWAAVLRANPVHTKLSRSTKCLSTRDWSIGITEMHLLRVFDRIEKLKDTASWSFRQPKKQRGVGGLTKTHWDYLLDEMRWMRTDFREERRWKLALAYNLAHAVMEWHEAGSLEERVSRGIVVLWKPPPPEDTEMLDGAAVEADGPFGETQDTDENGAESRDTGSQNDGYGSDDESEDEQDKDPVLDSLAPSQALQDALEQYEQAPTQQNSQDAVTFKPKIEEIEDLAALGGTGPNHSRDANAMEVDEAKPSQVESKKPEDASAAKPAAPEVHPGLKASSKNPILGPVGKEGEGVSGKVKPKNNHPVRDHILYSDVDKLFIDLDDLDLAKSMSQLSTEDPMAFPLPPVPPDLTTIFHDLPFYDMLDVAPPPNAAPDGNGKKKSDRRADRDDPNKRAEDAAYTKLTPTSKFMFVKPTLLGTLRPASNFKDGKWSQIEETPIFADVEVPSARPVDENLCALFEGTATKSNTPTGHPTFMPPPPRDVRKRNADHGDAVVWTPAEDALLKQAVERYPYNWHLIADSFNSSRVTISTDKRSFWECMERWKEKFSAAARADAAEDNTPGVKRSANQSVAMSSNGAGGANQGEPRKRRRHAAMHDTIKRTAKRREQAQKSNGANTNGVPRSANGVPQVAQIRSGAQVGISQQRIAAALAANATSRMSPPQLAAHMRAMAASGQGQSQGQAPTPAQSPPQGQVPAQVQVPLSNASAALTAAAPALSAAHLSPSFAARATSASPGAPHHSPPLPAASPPNATAVARPPSVPGQPVQGMQVNPLLQMPAQFYLQNMQSVPAMQGMRGGQFTPEQIHALLQTPDNELHPTKQDGAWKQREQVAENQYARAKVRQRVDIPFDPLRSQSTLTNDRFQEAEQLKAIRDELANKQPEPATSEPAKSELDRDFEGGYGGQEDLEDRYATTCGEH
uniref:Vacuolar import and degradation protein 21 n=1 Tax=Ganoderma boninense TaxID=34458 RepID=A0A5K1K084_9APHY|nr:RNA pyrophosphohydrolase (EC ((Di)nucleoside polyphosphate hydrolase) [Ganoderma boninense]